MIIDRVNWRTGLFRLWLSGAVLWWVAITTGLIADASRDALLGLRQSQGMVCAPDSSLLGLADASACKMGEAVTSSATGRSLGELLPMALAHLHAEGRWAGWAYLTLVPLGVLAGAALGRRWAGWVGRGFTPGAPPGAQGAGTAARPCPAPATAVDAGNPARSARAGSASDRERTFRASIVRATQALNGLDSELAELEPRMAGASHGLAKTLRGEIPVLGRRLIELVKTLDKEGLASADPLFSEKVKAIRP